MDRYQDVVFAQFSEYDPHFEKTSAEAGGMDVLNFMGPLRATMRTLAPAEYCEPVFTHVDGPYALLYDYDPYIIAAKANALAYVHGCVACAVSHHFA